MGNNQSQNTAASKVRPITLFPEQSSATVAEKSQLWKQKLQHKPIRRTSSRRGYRNRTESIHRTRSCLFLESSNNSNSPAKITLEMEAKNNKLQEENALRAACARGDLSKVEKLVDSGVDVNSSDRNQMTALHFSAMHSRDQVIKFLISRGAAVNTTDLKGGFSAIHWVIINAIPQYSSTDHLEGCLTALTEAGCRVNATDFNYATPLHMAARKGNKDGAQVLLRLGADPNKVDITGRNCFEVAKNEQMKNYIKTLLNISPKKNDQRHTYHILQTPPPSFPAPSLPVFPPSPAVSSGEEIQEQRAELIIGNHLSKRTPSGEQLDWEWQQQLQYKPIRRTSSQRGYLPQTESLRKVKSCFVLVSSNANSKPLAKTTLKMGPENTKLQEENALLAACARRDLSKVEKLMDLEVDVDSYRNQMTALRFAAMHSRDEVLISRGAEMRSFSAINAIPKYSSTDHLESCLTARTEAGCRLDTTDFNYATPLHMAQRANRNRVQVLSRLGADPKKVDATGRNCFEVAKNERMKNYVKTALDMSPKKKADRRHTYYVLESPPPSFPAPLPPVLPPSPVYSGKSSQDEHIYHTPKFNSPPSSPPGFRPTSATPPPPPPHKCYHYLHAMDSHLYHVLEPIRQNFLSPCSS